MKWYTAALTECYPGPSPNGSRSMAHSDDGTWCGSGISQCSRCRRLCSCSTSAKVSAKCISYRHAGHVVQLLTNVLLKLIKLPDCCALSNSQRLILWRRRRHARSCCRCPLSRHLPSSAGLLVCTLRFAVGPTAAEIAEAEAAGEELLPLPVEPTLSEVLEEGLSRLQTDKNTWKVGAPALAFLKAAAHVVFLLTHPAHLVPTTKRVLPQHRQPCRHKLKSFGCDAENMRVANLCGLYI